MKEEDSFGLPCRLPPYYCAKRLPITSEKLIMSIPPELLTLDYHLQHPEISLERHFRSKALATADRVLARKIIYLDTRFWILLRDVCLGRSTAPLHQQMLDELRLLVSEGKAICPINADTLTELLKQRDKTTRGGFRGLSLTVTAPRRRRAFCLRRQLDNR